MKVEMIDELLKDCKTTDDIFGEGGLVKQFVKALSERALQAELTNHLGYEKHEIKGNNSGNSRQIHPSSSLHYDAPVSDLHFVKLFLKLRPGQFTGRSRLESNFWMSP